MSLWVTALIPHMLLIWNDKWFLLDGGTLGGYFTRIIVHTFGICGAGHVNKNSKYPCAKIILFIDLKLLVLVVLTKNTDKFNSILHRCSNLGTGTFSIFGHVTYPANFKRADYSIMYIAVRKKSDMFDILNVEYTYRWSLYLGIFLSVFTFDYTVLARTWRAVIL